MPRVYNIPHGRDTTNAYYISVVFIPTHGEHTNNIGLRNVTWRTATLN